MKVQATRSEPSFNISAYSEKRYDKDYAKENLGCQMMRALLLEKYVMVMSIVRKKGRLV